MAKLISLNESFIPEFESMLGGGMIFGSLLIKRDLGDGSLSAWVSERIGEISPHQLRTDIFWPHPFKYNQELYVFFDRFFEKNRNGILVADTPLTPSMPNNQKFLKGLEWFSCDGPWKEYKQRITVYVTSQSAEHNRYKNILGVAWHYPTTILLTSLPPDQGLRNEAHYGIDSETIRHLIERVDHIMLGIFDERSMAVWTP